MQSNSYSLDACVVVQLRGQPERFTGPFTIGLLTAPPTPEGSHAQELQAPGYIRQRIDLGPPANGKRGGSQRNAGRASFGAIAPHAEKVRCAAIFRDDEIVAYGLYLPAPGHVGPDEIAFEPGAVRVRF